MRMEGGEKKPEERVRVCAFETALGECEGRQRRREKRTCTRCAGMAHSVSCVKAVREMIRYEGHGCVERVHAGAQSFCSISKNTYVIGQNGAGGEMQIPLKQGNEDKIMFRWPERSQSMGASQPHLALDRLYSIPQIFTFFTQVPHCTI